MVFSNSLMLKNAINGQAFVVVLSQDIHHIIHRFLQDCPSMALTGSNINKVDTRIPNRWKLSLENTTWIYNTEDQIYDKFEETKALEREPKPLSMWLKSLLSRTTQMPGKFQASPGHCLVEPQHKKEYELGPDLFVRTAPYVLQIIKRHWLIAGLQIIHQHQPCSLLHFWQLPLQHKTWNCPAMVWNLARRTHWRWSETRKWAMMLTMPISICWSPVN